MHVTYYYLSLDISSASCLSSFFVTRPRKITASMALLKSLFQNDATNGIVYYLDSVVGNRKSKNKHDSLKAFEQHF